jgi:hypothetical protein
MDRRRIVSMNNPQVCASLSKYAITDLEIGKEYLWIRLVNQNTYRVQRVEVVEHGEMLIKEVLFTSPVPNSTRRWIPVGSEVGINRHYMFSLDALPEVEKIILALLL